MSGQMSGQVSNQAGSQLPGLPQQNGSSLPSQIQNLGAHRNTGNMEPDIARAWKNMQVKIYEYITQRQSSPHDLQPKRVEDIVRRLDDVLFRSVATKEDYANPDTLESRLHGLIKGLLLSNHNQQFPQAVNSSSAINTMIPTPGMSQSGNSNLMVTSSVDTSIIAVSASNSIAPTIANTGSLLPPGSGSSVGIHSSSFNSSDGSLCNGYQQSTSSFFHWLWWKQHDAFNEWAKNHKLND
ncbi:hypothetical protein AAG906_017598 [Vitis piasezkii]